MKQQRARVVEGRIVKIALALGVALLTAVPALAQTFTPGNLVVAVEGNGVYGATSGPYGDNQASPLTLFQYAPNGTTGATFVDSLVLPQSSSGPNSAVSGEYGSSSEGTLQLSGNGYYLTIMGYGVNAATFNANPGAYSPSSTNTALGQSGSVTGQLYTPVPRVVALIDAYGNVNSTTAIYNVFNANNPRSAYTADLKNIYVSGQGTSGDSTGGVFYTILGSTSATPITGLDTSGGTAGQDTRTVQIFNNTLYVSVDSKQGSGSNRDYIGTLGSPPSTSLYNNGAGPTMLPGFGNSGGTGKVTITTGANSNGNGPNAGKQINLSPVNYFFANSTTLYVADSGAPKNDSATSSLGNGGLQKWIFSSGSWTLAYTLHAGLGLVANTSGTGSSGLYGLTGVVAGGQVKLYATNYTLSDLDPTFLYGISDTLTNTTASGAASETFTQLAAAPADSNFKGVSFAPVAAPQAFYIADSQNVRVRAVSNSGTIASIAGDGTWGYNGDEQPALSAWLSRPQSVAVDSLGNAFIADTGNYRVREVAASGIITTVAGGGSGGDGSLAVNAGLSRPVGVAVDGHDNLFIVDGDRIREVTAATGIITTVAGVGYGGAGGDGGLAVNAQLNGPLNVAVDAFDNLYIADAYNNRIRMVTAATGVITTVAGTGAAGYGGDGGPATSAQLAAPSGVAVDSLGNIYIADYSNSVIRKVTAATGVISTVAGNGTAGYSGDGSAAISAELNYPTEVAVDSLGDLFIADYYNSRIREVAASTGVITTVAGNGVWGYNGDVKPATSAELNLPTGVAVPTPATP